MKHVFEANNNIEAHMIIGLLKQAGITGHIHGEYLQGGIGELPPNSMIKIAVNNDDVDIAQDIINNWEKNQPPPPTNKTYPKSQRISSSFYTFFIGFLTGIFAMWWLSTLG